MSTYQTVMGERCREANARLALRVVEPQIRAGERSGSQAGRRLRDVSEATRPWITAAAARRQACVKSLEDAGYAVVQGEVRNAWRLVIGIDTDGGSTSLALHPTYGFPVLPGSALKGVGRRAAAERASDLFGADDASTPSRVTVLDALPTGDVRFVHDVLTPHGGNDWTDPVPVEFTAVEGGVFLVMVVDHDAHGDAARAAMQQVQAGLADLGIGAKTAAGYGYLDPTSEPSQSSV